MRNKYTPIAMVACLIMSCSMSNTTTVAISNDSGAEIESLKVDVSDHEQTIKNMLNGKRAKFIFQGIHDAHYVLNGEFSDGTKIHGEIGYVTDGMDFNDSFEIHEGGKVEFKSGPH